MIIQRVHENNTRQWMICPEGWTEAIIGDVVDLGLLTTKYGQKRHVRFVWFTQKYDSDGQRYRLFQQFSVSGHPQSNLMMAIESILDHPVTAPFDTEQLIGARAKVRVKHVLSSGNKEYANIVAIVPSDDPEGAQIPADYVRVCDRQRQEGE